MKRLPRLLTGLFALAAGTFAEPGVAKPVCINVPTWVGFGPLYVAEEQGFFKAHGIEVELMALDRGKEFFPILLDGKCDMSGAAVGTVALYLKRADDLQYLAITDDSNGGDGIVARNGIDSLADLKGKIVAVDSQSISEFYLNALLRQAALSEKDIALVNLSPGDAGKAFLARRVDAAVTWEPYLSEAKRSDFGHLLIDSSATPGLVSDVLVARKQFVVERPAEAAAVVAAWDDAVTFVTEHPREANAIMARRLGGWLKDADVFAETLATVRLYGAEDSRTMFGSAAHPGPLYDTVKEAIEIWTALGQVKIKVTPEDVINYGFLGG